jgi:hypothetical protein
MAILGKNLLSIKFVFWFSVQILSEKVPILRRVQRDIIINIYRYSCKVPVILVRFWWHFQFSRHIFEKSSNIKFYYNSPMGPSCSMRTDRQADGRTDMTKLIVDFRNFADGPKNCSDKYLASYCRVTRKHTCRPWCKLAIKLARNKLKLKWHDKFL